MMFLKIDEPNLIVTCSPAAVLCGAVRLCREK